MVGGFGRAAADRLVAARGERPFACVDDLVLRAALSRRSTTFLDVLCECGVVQPAGRIVRR